MRGVDTYALVFYTSALVFYQQTHKERMAYHRGQRSIRETYDECYYQGNDSREVTFQRVVNIVERRCAASRPEAEHDQGNFAPEWHDSRFNGEENDFYNFERNPTPPQEDNAYYGGEREDTRQVEISRPWARRKARGRSGAPRPYQDGGSRKQPLPRITGGRGQSNNNNNDGHRILDPQHPARDRSPLQRDSHRAEPGPHPAAGFRGQGRSFSPPDQDSSYTYQQLQQRRKEKDDGPSWKSERSRTSVSQTSSGADEPTQESRPASVAESPEAAADASSEPSLEPSKDFRTRRSQAIASKALEIEELYTQDCQTFGTVVQLLVEKEPSLEGLLRAPLRDNLLELKQRCLDDLRHFIKELDQRAGGGGATTTTTIATIATTTTTTTTTTTEASAATESSAAATEAPTAT